MALYNVKSPGGYQLTGLTIPGVDVRNPCPYAVPKQVLTTLQYLGSKKHYSLSRPWLFEDFDQLTFHEVPEAEYERQLALFHSGRYEYQIEPTTFDMAAHNLLLEQTKDEVSTIRKKQKQAQDEMQKLEDELMEKWMKEKAAGKIPMDKVEALLSDPGIEKISSPLNANVWKVTAQEGQSVGAGEVVAILEAMKLEISVRAEEGVRGRVERLLVRPGDVVNAGDPLVLVRKG